MAPTGTRIPRFETLPERLFWARDTAPLTQKEMAAQLAVSVRTVQNYEAGQQTPKPARVLLWANACDVNYTWLLTGTYGAEDQAQAASGGDEDGPSTDVRSTKSSGRCTQSVVASRSLSVDQYVLVPA